VKLEHLVGFITKKFVAIHGHMNVQNKSVTRKRFIVKEILLFQKLAT